MELRDKAKLLFAWFNDHYEEMLGKIELIVNMDSFSHDGKDVNVLGETVCSFFEGTDFITEKAAKKECPEDEPWQAELGNVLQQGPIRKKMVQALFFWRIWIPYFPRARQASVRFISIKKMTGPTAPELWI